MNVGKKQFRLRINDIVMVRVFAELRVHVTVYDMLENNSFS